VSDAVTIAVPKGRILKPLAALLTRAGVAADVLLADDRALIRVAGADLRFLLLKPDDVPTYVEYGAADLGVCGRDVLVERESELYQPIDLGIGRCRMVVAEPQDRPVDENAQMHLRYASKFVEITRRHLQSRGTVAEIIKLYGSIEIAPLVGLADRIVDLDEPVLAQRLARRHEVETIMNISARLCVGRAPAKLYAERIDDLVGRLREAVRIARAD
jgi:ATP phosphoribosyltransferase